MIGSVDIFKEVGHKVVYKVTFDEQRFFFCSKGYFPSVFYLKMKATLKLMQKYGRGHDKWLPLLLVYMIC